MADSPGRRACGPAVRVEYTLHPRHRARHKRIVTNGEGSGGGDAAVTTKYLYDGDNVVAEYVTSATAADVNTATYVTPLLDQSLSMTIPAGTIAAGLGREGTHWYVQDGPGSVRNPVKSTASAVTNTYDYEAFGQPFHPTTRTLVPNPCTFTSREADPPGLPCDCALGPAKQSDHPDCVCAGSTSAGLLSLSCTQAMADRTCLTRRPAGRHCPCSRALKARPARGRTNA